jgi:hypothetical protein
MIFLSLMPLHTPVSLKKERIQRATVAVAVAVMMRFNMQDKEILGPFADGRLKRFLKNIYDLRQSTGHKAMSFAKLEKKAATVSSRRDVFVGVVKVKIWGSR